LFEKVHEGEMPPAKNPRLSPADVETIRRWIEAGRPFGTTADARTEHDSGTSLTQHDVIPILLRRCTVCHGLRRRDGDLDLRSKAGIPRGGKSGPAIVPGHPDRSPLIAKIRANEMPPRDQLNDVSLKPIEPAEVDLLARWVGAGAPETDVVPDVA